MENPESQTPQEKKALDDSLKLAIREEVENEVQKRIKRQEWFYWSFLGLFVVFAGAFAYALWHVQLSELPKVVQQQLAEDEVIKAKDRIMEIKSSAETINQNLNDTSATVSNILTSISANQQTFTNRLNEIKQQDNVVLTGDLWKFFIVETMTNWTEERKIILNYDPVPQTVRIFLPGNSRDIRLDRSAYVEDNAIIFTNENTWQQISNQFRSRRLQVEYLRKSLH
jgi:hypothetical protein